MPLPTAAAHPYSTYRLQLRPEFTFDDAAARAGYLADLGVTHLYVSPILEAVPGSVHGYDVVDHSAIREELGGAAGFERLCAAATQHGLGVVVDVVPNHMAVPTPAHLNPAWWSILREGPDSEYASWIDTGDEVFEPILIPVLGARIGRLLGTGELVVDTSPAQPVLRYHDHVFPIRPGTEHLPLAELLDRQWYRLAYWKMADDELNYRRFFDVDTLIGVRVERPDVFERTHRVLLDYVGSGHITGLRIDHPDGLADPAGYLHDLHKEAPEVWVVVEKILEGDETLANDWLCHGTTGYDALWRIGAVFEDPVSLGACDAIYSRYTGTHETLKDVVAQAKRDVVTEVLRSEIAHLADLAATICAADVRLRDHSRRGLEMAISELLIAGDRYRAYIRPGEDSPADELALLGHARDSAAAVIDEDYIETLDVVHALAAGLEVGSAARHGDPDRARFCVRFAQTCGPVMAKGTEDTAFYRYLAAPWRLEVGSAAAAPALTTDAFYDYARDVAHRAPLTLTCLSTHDTKRSEDTRAAMRTLAENPERFEQLLRRLDELAGAATDLTLDAPTRYLLWCTAYAVSDGDEIPVERICRYLEKATREAKVHTSWIAPDTTYDAELVEYAEAVLADPRVTEALLSARADDDDAITSNVLGQKLIQLLMPGVCDVYQGTEAPSFTLVDPDNRELVDYEQLSMLAGCAKPATFAERKVALTRACLHARRLHPDVFFHPDATFAPLAASTSHVLGFHRSHSDAAVIALATRLPVSLATRGGFGDHEVTLPEGSWHHVLTSTVWAGGTGRIAHLLGDWPVALLVREA